MEGEKDTWTTKEDEIGDSTQGSQGYQRGGEDEWS